LEQSFLPSYGTAIDNAALPGGRYDFASRGTKRICQSATCALPFYDLNRTDILCSNFGTVFDANVVLHPRRAHSVPTSWKGSRRNVDPIAAASVAELKLPLQSDEEDVVTPSADDEIIDADAGMLPLEDEADGEIADVVVPSDDDQMGCRLPS
jgi:uncharacterized protein (TIGR02300 family)